MQYRFERKAFSAVCVIWNLFMLLWQCVVAPFVFIIFWGDYFSYWWILVSAIVTFNLWLVVGNLLYQSKNEKIKRGTSLYKIIALGIGELFGLSSLTDANLDEKAKGDAGCFIFFEVIIFLAGLSIQWVIFDISFSAPFNITILKLSCFVIAQLFTAAMTCSFWSLATY